MHLQSMSLYLTAALGLGLALPSVTYAALTEDPAQQACERVPYSPVSVPASLSTDEIAALSKMREEEKLARDIYKVLQAKWNLPQMDAIIASEQKHMDRVKVFLDAYGLPDSAIAGEVDAQFNNTVLQALYAQLTQRGLASKLDALQTAAYVEELDIKDLQDSMVTTQNPDMRILYSTLVEASFRHLKAFTTQIKNMGQSYSAQVLSQQEVQTILALTTPPPVLPAASINLQTGQPQTTTACINQAVSASTGKSGNGLSFSASDDLQLSISLAPETNHVGQTGDIVNVVSYAPSTGGPSVMGMRNPQGTWELWDGNPAHLIASTVRSSLRAQEVQFIYQGALPLSGAFMVFTGYRIQDGSLVFNANPLTFSIR